MTAGDRTWSPSRYLGLHLWFKITVWVPRVTHFVADGTETVILRRSDTQFE